MMIPTFHPRATAGCLTALAMATVLLLSGCASVVVPPSEVPVAQARHVDATQPSPAANAAGVNLGTPSRAWWLALKDPTLDELMRAAMQGNHEVKAALAAVQAARALTDAARRDGLPLGSLQAQAQVQRPSLIEVDPYRQGLPRPPESRVISIGQGLAWEIDLFGRVGTAAAVAERRADAAAADLHAASALLQVEVVRHYVQLRMQQRAQVLLASEAELLVRRATLMDVRVTAGLADRREALAAAGERTQVEAELAQSRALERVHAGALAVLTGRSPTSQDAQWQALLAPGPLPAVPAVADLVQPSDLLARRPDVARADAELRAALGETVLAGRAHLPRLSLNLTAGLNAPFGALNDSGAFRYAAGPQLSWDWLDAGRIRAREAAAKAGGEAAWHRFEQTVLQALKDSEASLSQWSAAQQTLAQAKQGELLGQQADEYAQARVSAGLEPPGVALSQAAALQRSRRAVLNAQTESLQAYAQVQLALGAWQPDMESPVQSRAPGQ